MDALKFIGFGLSGEPDRVTFFNWYQEKRCRGCGGTFLTLVHQQEYCSDKCKWMPVKPPILIPIRVAEERRYRAPRVLLGCERCANITCVYHAVKLSWHDKKGNEHAIEHCIQSESPYGCNAW